MSGMSGGFESITCTWKLYIDRTIVVLPATHLHLALNSTSIIGPQADHQHLTIDTEYTHAAKMTGLTGMFSERYTIDDIPDQTGKVALVTGGRSVVSSSLSSTT